MKLLYIMFVVVSMIGFNSSIVFAETNEELISKCDDKKDMTACMKLVDIYGNKKDYSNAHKYIDKACKGGDMTGCLVQGSLHLKGVGVEKNSKKAIKYYNKACDGGEMVGCGVIGSMYEEGIEVDINFKKALEYYQLACDGGKELGCSSFKELYEKVCSTDPKKFCKKYK